MEALRDLLVVRIGDQRDVGHQHHRGGPLRRVVRLRHGLLRLGVLGGELVRTGRALGQLPLVVEQVLEVAVVPLGWIVGPGALEPAADRIAGYAAAMAALPAKALVLDAGTLGFGTFVIFLGGTMGFAERVSAGDKRNRFLVVHRHAAERLSNVLCCSKRIRVTVWPLRIDVDQAHLNGAERIRQLAVAAVALVVEPHPLGAPVDVLLGRPDVLAAAAEAEGLEAHRFQGAVPGEDQKVGPRDLAAILLLDRPEQPARLVEAHVVGPAVEGGKALVAAAAAATAVLDAVRARGVPRHPDEERSVVAIVGRPPVLRLGHQRIDVLRQGFEVEALELRGVVERLAVGIGLGVVLAEDPEVQLVRPPVLVRCAANGLVRAAHHWALACAIHVLVSHNCTFLCNSRFPS